MKTCLEISCLRHHPAVDELLRVLGKPEEEIAIRLELIDGLNRLVNLRQHVILPFEKIKTYPT